MSPSSAVVDYNCTQNETTLIARLAFPSMTYSEQ